MPSRPRPPLPATALLALVLASAGGCTWFKSNPMVLITSDPAGARIFIDGTDMGRTTPARFELAGTGGYDHVVKLTRKGYRPETRILYQHTEGYTSKWIDGASGAEMSIPPMPFFWTLGDFAFPFAMRGAIVPGELHVKLYREDDPPLGREALEQQRRAGKPPDTPAAEPRSVGGAK